MNHANGSSFDSIKRLYNQHNYSGCIELINHDYQINHSDSIPFSNSYLLGKSYFQIRDFRSAIKTFQKVISFKAGSKENKLYKLRCINELSRTYLWSLNIDSAKYWNSYSKKFQKSNQINLIENSSFIQKAELHLYISLDSSKFYLDKVRKSIDNDSENILFYYMALSQYYLAKNDIKSSYKITNKGLELFKKNESSDSVNWINLHLLKGFYTLRTKGAKSSVSYFENYVRPLLFKHHSRNNQAYDYLKGEFYRLTTLSYSHLGNFNKTVQYTKLYLDIAIKSLDPDNVRLGEIYRDLAESYLKKNRIATYIKYIDLSIEILSKYNSYKNYVSLANAKRYYYSKNYANCIKWSNIYMKQKQLENKKFTRSDDLIFTYKLWSHYQLSEYDSVSNNVTLLNEYLQNINLPNENLVNKYELFKVITLEKKRNSIEKKTKISIEVDTLKKEIESIYKSYFKTMEFSSKRLNGALAFINAYSNYVLNEKIIDDKISSLLDKAISYNYREISLKNNAINLKQIKNCYQLLISTWLKSRFHYFKYNENHDFLDLNYAFLYADFNHRLKSMTLDMESEVIDQLLQIENNLDEDILMKITFKRHKDSVGDFNLSYIFNSFESKKSIILFNNIVHKQLLYMNHVPDSLLMRKSNLEKRISGIKERLKSVGKSEDSRITQEYRRNLIEGEQLLTLLNIHLREEYNIKFSKNSQNIIELDEVMSKLSDSELLIYYTERADANYTLAISTNETFFHKLNPLRDSVVSQFRNSLDPATSFSKGTQNGKDYLQSAYAIYESQLKPVLDKFPDAKKIIVIPDGQLHHVPFDALISELPKGDGLVDYASLHYLIKDYTFSYAYSATTLFKTKSLLEQIKEESGLGNRDGQQVLAFAPSYDSDDNSDLNTNLLAQRRSKKQPLSNIRGNLSNLDWNDEEVAGIGDYFQGKSLFAEMANEKDFKKEANNYDILHLSMHAVVDAEDPMYSYLAFAPDPQDTSTGDGFLHAFEIYDLDLKADMAVLSACNTGYGKLYKGEGPLSLAKAFTYAGCPSVVMSYWAADDRSSSDIMKLFYGNLAEGMEKDEALRQAKLTFFETASPFKKSPAFWNNFVVMGDTSPIIKDHSRLYFYVAGAFLMLIALVFVGWKFLYSKTEKN